MEPLNTTQKTSHFDQNYFLWNAQDNTTTNTKDTPYVVMADVYNGVRFPHWMFDRSKKSRLNTVHMFKFCVMVKL